MSYSSRVYRQRNPRPHEESKEESFFSKQHDSKKPAKKTGFFQSKLAINKPGDSYEREADAVANTVVNNPGAGSVVQQKKISSIQRLSTPAEDEKLGTNDARMKKDKDIQEKAIQPMGNEPEKEKKGVQKKDEPKKEDDEMKKQPVQKKSAGMEPEKEKKDVQKKDEPKKEDDEMKKSPVQKKADGPMEPEKEKKDVQKKEEPKKEEEDKKTTAVQTKPEAGSATASAKLSAGIEQSTGKGRALPPSTLHEMNSGFGVDFSNVRIHNDGESVHMNNELEAQAFTHGADVYFNEGKFDPASSAGKFLLAHELTHVVQQKGNELQPAIQRQHAPAPAAKQQAADIPAPVPAAVPPLPNGNMETEIPDQL